MVKMRRLVPKSGDGGGFTARSRTISGRELRARSSALLKAGYLKEEKYPDIFHNGGLSDERVEWKSEISRLSNDYEIGLLSLSLRTLKKTNVLRGRRNHIKHIMKSRGADLEKAKRWARQDISEWGGKIGSADDYIEYYYNRFK